MADGFPVEVKNGAFNTPDRALFSSSERTNSAYSWGGGWNLAATPTDIMTIATGTEARSIKVRGISVQLYGDAAGTTPVPVSIIQRAGNTGGTTASVTLGRRDAAQAGVTATVTQYTANPSGLGGSAVTLDRKDAAVGTNAAPAAPVFFDFSELGEKSITLRSLFDGNNRIIAINLGGTTLPANPRVVVRLIIEEEAKRSIILIGDSLISADTGLQGMPSYWPGAQAANDIRFYGSNGKRLIDFLPTAEANVSGLTFGPAATVASIPAYDRSAFQPEVVLHYGTNDVRQGITSLDEMVARIDAFIQMVKYGTTSGATFTSNYTTRSGVTYASRTFTWNATLAARPHARIWLFTPNSYLADDPGSTGLIVNTGFIAGANLAAASQNATDMIWTAYQAFQGDPRLNGGGIIDSQTYVSPRTGYSFGRTVKTFANNSILMRDILHPSYDVGGVHKWEQLASVLNI